MSWVGVTAVLWRWSLLALVVSARGVSAFEMEMNQVQVQDTFAVATWTSVTFLDRFDVPPVVVTLPTTQGGDPSLLRLRNITTTGFQILQVEPNANDGPHVAMDTVYLALEPGDHVLPDGTRVQAFTHSTTSFVNRLLSDTWDTRGYLSPFAAAPALVATIQTMVNESGTPPATSSIPWLGVALRNVNAGAFDVSLERAESTAGAVTAAETIGFIAIDNPTNSLFVDQVGTSIRLQALRSANNLRGYGDGCFTTSWPVTFAQTPLAVAAQITRAGNNGGWVRRCSQSASSLGLTVDEDMDADAERNHTSETAGIIGASGAFHANFSADLTVAKQVVALSDPHNGTVGPFAIPGAVMRYDVQVTSRGSLSPDTDSVTITDQLPPQIALCVSPLCLAGGPVVFDASGSPVGPGVVLGAIEYSNNGGLSYGYTPLPDGDGFDAAVDALRISLQGDFSPISSSGAPSVVLRFAARVR